MTPKISDEKQHRKPQEKNQRALEDTINRNAHPQVLVPFSHRCGKTLNKDSLEEERANVCSWHVRLHFTMVGKAWQQEHGTATHATSVIRKQRNERLSSAHFLLLHRSGCQSMG